MTTRDNILHELNELKSSLASLNPGNVYSVPAGYFDGLADQVLSRIKSLETADPKEELLILSEMLGHLPKQMPYAVPAGYFEGLAERALESVQKSNDYQTANEELASLSPLLSGLKKEMPYEVPAGYFEGITKDITEKSKPETKVVSLGSRSWFRYAAAAVVTGVIILGSFMIFNNEKIDPASDSHAWVKKSIKKVSTDKLEEFIELVEDEKSVASNSTVKQEEIKELIKDIPDSEIQNFLNETDILDGSDKDDLLLN